MIPSYDGTEPGRFVPEVEEVASVELGKFNSIKSRCVPENYIHDQKTIIISNDYFVLPFNGTAL